jgi:hypothetical protein
MGSTLLKEAREEVDGRVGLERESSPKRNRARNIKYINLFFKFIFVGEIPSRRDKKAAIPKDMMTNNNNNKNSSSSSSPLKPSNTIKPSNQRSRPTSRLTNQTTVDDYADDFELREKLKSNQIYIYIYGWGIDITIH